ncbi:hypothetical protein E8E12_002197 [Didymella heteroderae]|uniref:Uncharacterized protein n=1 Tax=Didymella heteroderae TaxID=1769908 RepID=A0A9P4WVC2_9PLEO|nr:hypothetical protein E8E12_002197 [Didymella heteroderae]
MAIELGQDTSEGLVVLSGFYSCINKQATPLPAAAHPSILFPSHPYPRPQSTANERQSANTDDERYKLPNTRPKTAQPTNVVPAKRQFKLQDQNDVYRQIQDSIIPSEPDLLWRLGCGYHQ